MANNEITTWFDELDSTNNAILRDIENLPSGAVYAAFYQTAGKGQRGNGWESGRGDNLTFSILFRPSALSASRQFVISEVVALGIAGYLAAKGIAAKIKWPNDIYVGDKKICGILIENAVSGIMLKYSVVGIGFNLNQTRFLSDAPNPVSLKSLTGESYNLRQELELLLKHIFEEYDKVIPSADQEEQFLKATADLERRYTALLYRLGEYHNYIDRRSGETIRGRILGIAPNACLILESDKGTREEFAFKEIAYIIN